MANEDTTQVVKGGETRLRISVSRSVLGLQVTAKAHPQIEEFMRTLSNGATVDVKTLTRNWVPAEKEKPFLAYMGGDTKIPNGAVDDFAYSVDGIGGPLVSTSNGLTNISFLRLAGISEEAGVSFMIRGVFSIEQTRTISSRLGAAARRFYIDYLRPVNLSVAISTQELRL